MQKCFVCVVSSRAFCSDIEELSDIIVSCAETGVLVGHKNRVGNLWEAADRIRGILDGSPKLKMPQPGQWWGNKDNRRFYCAGMHQDTGEYVVLRDQDTHYKVVRFSGDLLSSGWKHLPECNSFDWVDPSEPPKKSLQEIVGTWPTCEKHEAEPPKPVADHSPSGQIDSLVDQLEQKMVDQAESVLKKLEGDVAAGGSFPQYWTTLDKPHEPAAFIRRETKDSYTIVYKDGGTNGPFVWHLDNVRDRRLLTEAEAMALLNKPAEDPEEWVIQDRVPARVCVDHQRWSDWTRLEWGEVRPGFTSVGRMHGYTREGGERLELRCRRKDLPVVVQNVDEDWVELPPEHELRKGIDQIEFSDNNWHVVDGYAGTTVEEFGGKARCLRKDLPPIEPEPAPIASVSCEDRLLTQLEKMVSILEQQGEILKQLASHKKN